MTGSRSYFTVTSDDYKQNIFSGFVRLQAQQEFVDLTLAADGHIVKVHKNIMALASPYIKELLTSVTSDNPVIFLNNVNHVVLSYLLEYIYQGEVDVPEHNLEQFMQLSRSLHITGMGQLKNNSKIHMANQNFRQKASQQQIKTLNTITLDGTLRSDSNVAAQITIKSDQNIEIQPAYKSISNLEQNSDIEPAYKPISNSEQNSEIEPAYKPITNSEQNSEMNIIIEKPFLTNNTIEALPIIQCLENIENNPGASLNIVDMCCEDDNAAIQKDESVPTIQILNDNVISEARLDLKSLTLDQMSKDALKLITQYSVSERGAVQIIVNRYIYYNHHSSRKGLKHRWRCIDYRRNQCQAYIDSLDNTIVLRHGVHNHSFHDDKIYKKHRNHSIYHSVTQAQNAWNIQK